MKLKDAKYALETISKVMYNYEKEIEYHQSEIDYYKRMNEGRKAEIAELKQIIKDYETPQNPMD